MSEVWPAMWQSLTASARHVFETEHYCEMLGRYWEELLDLPFRLLVVSGYAEVDGIAPDLPRLTSRFVIPSWRRASRHCFMHP